jgi:diphthine synthase
MTLHIIGIGLENEKDITVKGLEVVKKADVVYLESYTSKLNCSKEQLEKFYLKKIILADRAIVEGDDNEILKHAKTKDVALLVIGDPFSATTHMDLFLRAKKEGITVTVTNNTSVLTAVGITGLQLYKFGKTTSIPYPEENFQPETAYDVIKMNQGNGLHTLILLDIKPEQEKYMTMKEGIEILLNIEKKRKEKVFTKKTFCIGAARLGTENYRMKSGSAVDVENHDFGAPLHCLIVPGTLHFMEEEALKMWK